MPPISVTKHKAYWKINNLCNFQCEYCFYEDHKEHPHTNRHKPEEIVNAFNRTGETWTIEIDGGEPFLYPGFVDLLEKLTEKHYVVVVTNLSRTKPIREFSDRISPERAIRIGASLHMLELDKRGEVDTYIDNYSLLKERGFNIDATYVCYPPLIRQLVQDYEFFKSRGITFYPVVFQGQYMGKEYPESYTETEKSIIKSISSDPNLDISLKNGKYSYYGHYCHAGSKLIDINEGGRVTPCVSAGVYEHISLGNLFNNSSKLLTKPRVCTFKYCLCPPEGLEFSEERKATAIKVAVAKISDEARGYTQIINGLFNDYI